MASKTSTVPLVTDEIAARPKPASRRVIDEIDYAILRKIQENSNRTYESISQLLKKEGFAIGGPAVGNRIDALRQGKYIAKECAILDYGKFDAGQMFLMLVKIPDKSGTKLDDFLASALENPDILEVHECIGQYDYALKIAASRVSDATQISKTLSLTGAQIETLPVNTTNKSTTALRIPRS